jgi:hypothetical protein
MPGETHKSCLYRTSLSASLRSSQLRRALPCRFFFLFRPPLHIAKRRTSLTRILWIDATSCTPRRKAKEEAAKEALREVTLCCSPKEEKEAQKERAKANGKAKESLERIWGIIRKGKRPKGKDIRGLGRSLDDTCHFCKLPGHYKADCPKFAALSSKPSYGRMRAKLSNEKVYVYDLLEDSVDSEVCWNCLCQECDWATCTPPVEAFLFHDASKSFVEDGMWDMVSSAKSSNPPLSKEIFLQERGLADDPWEDEAYGDQDGWGEDDESEEDN